MTTRSLMRRITTMLPAALLVACGEPTRSTGRRAALMQIVSGDSQQAVVGKELPTPLVVKVLDSAGAVVSGQLVNFRVVAGDGSVFAGASISNSAGLAQERWTLGTSTADSQRVEARAVDNATGAPLTFAVFRAVALPGPPASVVRLGGNAESAVVESAVAVPPAVRIVDSYGNPVPGITVTYAVASGGGSVAQPTQTTNDTGVATAMSWTLGPVAGPNTLTATVAGLPPVTFTAKGIAGAPASVTIDAGDNQSAVAGSAVPIPPSVVVKDAHGNVVSEVAVTFAVAGGGGTAIGDTVLTNAAGIAAVAEWTLGPTVGTNTLTATVTPVPAVTFTATGLVGPATLITRTAGNNQSATVGTAVAVPPAVRVTDQNQNPVAGVSVIFATRSGGGNLTGASKTTDASGDAAVGSWTLGTIAGADSVVARATGVDSTTFGAIGVAGPPASIAKRAGDSQVAVLGTLLGQTVLTPPAVRVTDVYGNPVPNANAVFSVASGGGSVIGGAAITDTSGIAAVGAWMVGSTPGGNTLTATVGGVPLVTFIATGTRITALGPGDKHTCAIGTGNAAYCWGVNESGELGDNTSVQRLAPTTVVGGVSFTTITGGDAHTCGLASSGAAYCWGNNSNNQFGDGTTTNSSSPIPVAGGLTFIGLTAGWFHTCGLTSAGAAYCWGLNDVGQLGDGTTTQRSSPTPVTGGLTFTAIVSSAAHTCGLTSTGAAYCWGTNDYGQLGDSTTEARSSPTLVLGGTSFVALVTGGSHTCGLSTTAVVLCWGQNGAGQLGDGTLTNRLTPTPMVPGLTIVAITAGSVHTCGLTNAGAAYCWGTNLEGELGSGSAIAQSSTPMAVAGGLTFTAVVARAFRTCAYTAVGSAYCWGLNYTGSLGDGTTMDRSTPAVVR